MCLAKFTTDDTTSNRIGRHVVPAAYRIAWTLWAVSAFVASGNALAADWTQFRGADGRGASPDKNLPTTWSSSENVLWKTALPGPGTSSPILIADRIYLTCYTGGDKSSGGLDALKRYLICLNRQDGTIRWTKESPAKLPEQENIREGHGYASSTPAADAKGVVVFYGKSGVIAYDHEGEQLWQADVGDNLNGWGSATSPVFYKNLVFINASVESDSLVALDRGTGKEVWRAGGVKEAWNTPILAKNADGKTELIVAIVQRLLAFDPDTGKPLWTCKTDINWYMAPSMVAHDGVVFSVGGRSGGALAVRLGGSGDVTASHRIWTGKKGSNVTSPIYHDGHLYWMNDNQGIAYCADAETGKLVYEERVRGANQVYASPVIADGKIYYFTREGRGLVVAAKPTFELLATNELERRGSFDSSPAVADGRIFVRSNKFLYCLGAKLAARGPKAPDR